MNSIHGAVCYSLVVGGGGDTLGAGGSTGGSRGGTKRSTNKI